MKYAMYVTRRYILTCICKFAAVLATKIKTAFTFNFLARALNARDIILCREAKYCMQRTTIWQQKAQRCIIAHHAYEKEMKKEQKVADKTKGKK